MLAAAQIISCPSPGRHTVLFSCTALCHVPSAPQEHVWMCVGAGLTGRVCLAAGTITARAQEHHQNPFLVHACL